VFVFPTCPVDCALFAHYVVLFSVPGLLAVNSVPPSKQRFKAPKQRTYYISGITLLNN